MDRNFAIATIIFIIIAIIAIWATNPNYRYRSKMTDAELNIVILEVQKQLIDTQQDLKISLKNQAEYIELLNEAFGKTVEMVKGEK